MNPNQIAVLQKASANTGGLPVPVQVVAGAVEVTVRVPADGAVVLKHWGH
jgi:hypothetical protein